MHKPVGNPRDIQQSPDAPRYAREARCILRKIDFQDLRYRRERAYDADEKNGPVEQSLPWSTGRERLQSPGYPLAEMEVMKSFHVTHCIL